MSDRKTGNIGTVKPSNLVTVHGIFNTNKKTIAAGEKCKLAVKIYPIDIENNGVIWKSSNTKYATVDKNGNVTTKLAGAGKNITITAISKDNGSVCEKINLKISKVKIKKIKLDISEKVLLVGNKAKINVNIDPVNATNKSLKWTVSNSKYATVTSNGVVTAKKDSNGKYITITAKAKDGSGIVACVKIKIVKKPTLKLTAKTKVIKCGEKVKINASISPHGLTNNKIIWKSSNKNYATVNSNGVVIAKQKGRGKYVTISAVVQGVESKIRFKII